MQEYNGAENILEWENVDMSIKINGVNKPILSGQNGHVKSGQLLAGKNPITQIFLKYGKIYQYCKI